MEMVTIPKKEYERLKKLAKVHKEADAEHKRALKHWDAALEDLKAGRVTRVR